MAEKAEDKNTHWREKYLNALDQQEQQENAFLAQQELLRRALVRVSISADGQDEMLDEVLAQLREKLRSTVNKNETDNKKEIGSHKDIALLLTRLDDAALQFEQRREKNQQSVRQSLSATLESFQTLELSRSTKKDIAQYLGQLSRATKKISLYPELLKQLAAIQQRALTEIAQPKKGLWETLVGAKSSKDNNKNTERHSQSQEALSSPLQQVKLTEQRQTINPNDRDLLDPYLLESAARILQQFLEGLDGEPALAEKIHAIRQGMNDSLTASSFISALDGVRELSMQAYLSANSAFAFYLKTVNQELAEINGVVGGAVEYEQARKSASKKMQASMLYEVGELEASSETATDLTQLKNQVRSQLGNIRQALAHFQQAEQTQQDLAFQLETLSNKIQLMEMEAEKNTSLLEKQRHKALHDPLTGLPNREYYNERSLYEFQRWQRYSRPLTLAVFDIDHFKKVNDDYGHQAGDQVLKVIGSSIAKRLRSVDFFCRFGGEEFVAVMPETQLEEAIKVLDKIRAAIANAAFNYKEQPLSITISIGMTEFIQSDSLDSAFARADKALYSAKSKGRNCIQSA
jgi:diguanylate cyclase